MGNINVASSYVKSAPDVTVDDNYVWLGSDHFRSNFELWCAQRATADGRGTSFQCGPKTGLGPKADLKSFERSLHVSTLATPLSKLLLPHDESMYCSKS